MEPRTRRASTMVRLDDLLSQVLAIKSSAGRKLVEAGEVTVEPRAHSAKKPKKERGNGKRKASGKRNSKKGK